MRIAGAVILYHPDADVLQNIHSYLPFLSRLYVIDNSENGLSNVASQLANTNNVQIICNGKNEGIAKRLNEAADMAIAEQFEWLLTMDQDSKFEEADIEKYLLQLNNFSNKKSVAVFGVEYENCLPVKDIVAQEVDVLITSGSIINLPVYAEIGGFDEPLFIDEVDTEYCFRAALKGYKIIKFSNVCLQHQLGVVHYHISLKTFKKSPRVLHSPRRLYYMVRNRLYVSKKYARQFPETEKILRRALLVRIKNNLLYGDKKAISFYNVCRALADYKRGRFGQSTFS